MRQRNLSRARRPPASDEAGSGDTVVWRPERRETHEPGARGKHARDGMDLSRLDRFRARKERQDRGKAPREHGLACARWAVEKHVMASSCRDLQRTARYGLTSDLREIHGHGRARFGGA